jgi:hypothetical protein
MSNPASGKLKSSQLTRDPASTPLPYCGFGRVGQLTFVLENLH